MSFELIRRITAYSLGSQTPGKEWIVRPRRASQIQLRYFVSATYVSLYIHVVFSTKNRKPWINAKLLERLHDYLGGTVRGLRATAIRIGGVDDHVHLLIGIKTSHRISDLVREIKKSSTSWMQVEISEFAWQAGYGVFSVSPERVAVVSKYIDNQAEHHQTTTFVEERIMLYRLAGIEFNPDDLD